MFFDPNIIGNRYKIRNDSSYPSAGIPDFSVFIGTRKPAAGYIYPLFPRLAAERIKETPHEKKVSSGQI